MKNILSDHRLQAGFLIISGIAIIVSSLIKHPEDWRNWLIRAGIGLVVVIVQLSVMSIIQYFKNRNLRK